MVRRSMRLMLIMVVMVVAVTFVVLVVIGQLVSGRCTAGVMRFRQKMNPDVIDVERKQKRREQTNPPPTRSRSGWQSALLT